MIKKKLGLCEHKYCLREAVAVLKGKDIEVEKQFCEKHMDKIDKLLGYKLARKY